MRYLRNPTAVVLVLGLAACAAEPGSPPSSEAPLTYEEFKAFARPEPDSERYVIDGDDPVLGEAGLRARYDEYLRAVGDHATPGVSVTRQGLTAKTFNGEEVKWDRQTALQLTYCVSQNGLGSAYQSVVDAMAVATAEWEKVAQVHFVHVASLDATCNAFSDVVFDVTRGQSGGCTTCPPAGDIAISFYPDFPRTEREFRIYQFSSGDLTLTGIVRHELGHIIGFRHEHIRSQAHPSGDCADKNVPAGVGWEGLTAYDVNSVMHYKWCNGNRGGDWFLTELDKKGARLYYPRRAGIVWRNSAGAALVWNDADSSWLTGFGGPDNNWQLQAIADFGGNHRSDLLWRAMSGPQDTVVSIWPDGNSAAWYSPGVAGHNWTLIGTGDFDGDNRSDVLWRDLGTGANVILYAGTPPAVPITTGVTSWWIAGIGDFDGDGRSDILWRNGNGQNAYWPAASPATQWLAALDTSWQLAGIGDFDNDGISDLLWRCMPPAGWTSCGDWPAGQVAIWHNADNNQTTFSGAPDPGYWRIQGVGDFDGDAQSDVLWRNLDGGLAIWRNGNEDVWWPGTVDNSWQIQGVGTFN